jgi:glycerol 2-dehydrogenase (NADP+)
MVWNFAGLAWRNPHAAQDRPGILIINIRLAIHFVHHFIMATICKETVKLNSGYEMPMLGLGTFRASNDDGYKAILHALKIGYRHLDTASMYENEKEVGQAIKDSNVPREEIFLTTKLNNRDHRHPAQALDESLQRLGVDYVDLYLMHWPVPLKDRGTEVIPRDADGYRDTDFEWSHIKTWELMQELPKSGKVRTIGVSNYDTVLYDELLNAPTTKVTPAVNQVELHPYLPEFKLVEVSREKGIVLTAYCPLGAAEVPVIQDEDVVRLAEKYNVTPAQVVLSWDIQRGVVAIPKSATPSRLESNLKTIKLAPEDLEIVSNLYKKQHFRRCRFDWRVKMHHDDDEWYDGNPPPKK